MTITEDQYKLALERLEALLPLDDPKVIELKEMSDIVIDYEKEHYPMND